MMQTSPGPGPRRAITRDLLERYLAKLSAAKERAAARTAAAAPPSPDPNRKPRVIGYARVSTDDQTTALQIDALRAAGCEAIHEDSMSGSTRSRPGLEAALADVTAGDTLAVWKLDRLGRSLTNLLEVAEGLRGRGVALRSLTEAIDTATPAGKMLYAVLGAVAQFERDIIRERTIAGMQAARHRGERLGRKPTLSPAQVREAREMHERGEGPAHICRVMRCGRSTLYRVLRAA